MPRGRTHDKISAGALPVIYFCFIILFHDLNIACIGLVAYLFASFMFSGDLDIASRQTNRWGSLKFIWIPYKKMFKHRSVFTHGFILGTIVRILYVFFLFLICLFCCSIIIGQNLSTFMEVLNYIKTFIFSHQKATMALLLGLEAGNSLHTASDLIGTYIKINFKKKKK